MGLLLGLVLVAGVGVWLATRPNMTASSRLRNMEPEAAFSDEKPRFVTPLPQGNTEPALANAPSEYNPLQKMDTRRFHIVRKGETLSGIAQRYYGTADGMQKLLKANQIDNPNKITPGTKLTIPD